MKYESEDNKYFFSSLYEEMTDPKKIEIAKMRERRDKNIRKQIKEYGV